MEKLVCEECGTKFNCGKPTDKNRCWCMELPNLRGTFDLADKCVCPDCLTQGKSKEITKMRKIKKHRRSRMSIR